MGFNSGFKGLTTHASTLPPLPPSTRCLLYVHTDNPKIQRHPVMAKEHSV